MSKTNRDTRQMQAGTENLRINPWARFYITSHGTSIGVYTPFSWAFVDQDESKSIYNGDATGGGNLDEITFSESGVYSVSLECMVDGTTDPPPGEGFFRFEVYRPGLIGSAIIDRYFYFKVDEVGQRVGTQTLLKIPKLGVLIVSYDKENNGMGIVDDGGYTEDTFGAHLDIHRVSLL